MTPITPDTTILDDSAPVTAAQLRALENRLTRSERRLRMTWGAALVGVVGAFALGLTPSAQAQYGVTLQSLQNQINGLIPRLASVESKTQFQIVSGTTTRFTGTNVQIVSGTGATNAAVNGLGNLIIGYNEERGFGNDRTGSHNLILGRENNYSSYGGLAAGYSNTISGPYSSVSGGAGNTASGQYASVSGGLINEASGTAASVSGGEENVASGDSASVSGGYQNTASSFYASVSGGYSNTASEFYASVSGGFLNTASGSTASVSGGRQNMAVGDAASVSGGFNRNASAVYDWRAGGLFEDF